MALSEQKKKLLKAKIAVALHVNPNIKLVGEYNYSGGDWLSLSFLFFAYRS
jgi:hypothetical protein